jgi:hypothetical protein
MDAIDTRSGSGPAQRKLLLGVMTAATLVVLVTVSEGAAWARCSVGTHTLPACMLPIPNNYAPNAQLTLPWGYDDPLSVTSTATYAGIDPCPQRFVVLVDGEGDWSRLTITPTRRPVEPGAVSEEIEAKKRECDCVNLEAEVLVRSLSEISHCDGGCSRCSLAEYCADPAECFGCSWTPVPLGHHPFVTKKATGIWVPESPRTGPAHCRLQVQFYRDTSNPSWSGDGGFVAAVVYDKRTGERFPLSVSARYSELDPAVLNGGCPNCGN